MTTIRELAKTVLAHQHPLEKIASIRSAQSRVSSGVIPLGPEVELTCALPPCPQVVPLHEMTKPAPGLNKEVQLLHSIAHIEYNAMNLYWDMLGRFQVNVPYQYYLDFASVACDEADHFQALDARLHSLGSGYGQLQVHNALSSGLQATSSTVLDRLVLTSLVHEARALDSHKRLASKFNSFNSNKESVRLLDSIVQCELTHVHIGLKWFRHLVDGDAKTRFREIVRKVAGKLRPPFDVEARDKAGFPRDWYEAEVDSQES
jgi:uncharacterized ferritin-like protein (DUF455 family)